MVESDLVAWIGFNSLGANLAFRDPIKVLTAYEIEDVSAVITQVEGFHRAGYYCVGNISYESSPAFDSALRVSPRLEYSDFPLVWFAIFDRPIAHSPELKDNGISFSEFVKPHSADVVSISPWVPSTTPAEYNEAVALVRDNICEGNTYQVNYTIRLHSELQGDDRAYMERLLQNQKGGNCAYLDMGKYHFLSASPEEFFLWNRTTNKLSCRPMKGTEPRGSTEEEDNSSRERLRSSKKDQAENLMIVDLIRNDMSRVAVKGTLHTPKESLFQIEEYPTVFHLTSVVECVVRESTTLLDVMNALFPCGSITGAPKVSTMKIISELEMKPRVGYCGSVICMEPLLDAYISRVGCLPNDMPVPSGRTGASVCIRSVLHDTETKSLLYGVGGGIVYDSTAVGEFSEVFTKAAVIMRAHISKNVASPVFDLEEKSVLNLSRNYPALSSPSLSSLFETIRVTCSIPTQVTAGDLVVGTHVLNGFMDHFRRIKNSFLVSKRLLSLELIKSTILAWKGWEEVSTSDAMSVWRLRLRVDWPLSESEPSIHIEMLPLISLPKSHNSESIVLLSVSPVNTRHPEFRHKCVNRTHLDKPKEEAMTSFKHHVGDSFPLYSPIDVLLYNMELELTEFTIGNIVLELPIANFPKISVPVCSVSRSMFPFIAQPLDGFQFVTPSLETGILPGTLRQRLLDEGVLSESLVEYDVKCGKLKKSKRKIILSDLHRANRIFLINSIRGMVPVRVMTTKGEFLTPPIV